MASLLIFSCLYFLYFRVDKNLNSLENSIAQIADFDKTVKLKKREIFTWINATNGQGLRGGDKLYTHKESRASIKFNSGDILNLSPLSLIEIQEGLQGVKLEKGSFTATLGKGNKPITLILGERSFSLNGKDSKVRIERTGKKATVTVLKGEVELKGRDEKIQSSSFDLNEESNLTDLKIKGFSYELNPLFKTNHKIINGESISFAWKANTSERANPQLLIKHGEKVYTQPLNEPQIFLKSSGHYVLQIIDDLKQISPVIDLHLKVLPLAKVRIPPEKGPLFSGLPLTFEISSLYPTKLSLQKKEGALLLSKDLPHTENSLDFKRFTLKLKEALDPGKYQLVISPQNKVHEDLKVIQDIEIKPPPTLSPPQLSSTQKEFIFYGKDPKPIVFKWQGTNPPYKSKILETYTLKISSSREDFQFTKIEALSFSWTPPLTKEKTQFQWRVRAKQKPFQSVFSNPLNFTITTLSNLEVFPMTGAVVELEKPQQEVTFEWERAKGQGYLLEVSKDPSFKKTVITKKTAKNRENLILPEAGVYYWRSRFIDETGEMKLGRPTQITIKPAPPPEPLKIEKEQKIKLKRKKTSSLFFSSPRMTLAHLLLKKAIAFTHANSEEFEATITWPSERLAKSYILRVMKGEKLLFEIESEKPEYRWKEARPGTYQYEVAIIDYWQRQGDFSNKGELILIAPEKEKKEIQLISPAHKRELRFEKTIFEFNSPLSKESTMEFSQNLDFKNPVISIPLASGKREISLNTPAIARKAKGQSLYWRVRQGRGKNLIKSKRRLISFHPSLLKKERRKGKSSDKLSYGDFEIFQTTTQTSYEQLNPGATISASGMTMLHMGIQWSGRSIDIPLAISLERGQGAAFEELDYNQTRAQIFYEFYGYLFDLPWIQKYGVEYQIQTFFLEQRASLESEEVGLFLGSTIQELELGENSLLSLKLAAGQGLNYALQYRHSLFHLWSYEFSLGLFYEGLKVTGEASDYEKDITRTNLGLTWFLTF